MMNNKLTKGVYGGIYPKISEGMRTEGPVFGEKEAPPRGGAGSFVPEGPGESPKTGAAPGATEEEAGADIPEVRRKITAREIRDGFILSVIVGEPVSRTLRRGYGRRRQGFDAVK